MPAEKLCTERDFASIRSKTPYVTWSESLLSRLSDKDARSILEPANAVMKHEARSLVAMSDRSCSGSKQGS